MSWEQIVIGTVLENPTTFLEARTLKPTDFREHNHNLIWKAIESMYAVGGLSVSTVEQSLRGENKIDVIGDGYYRGADYLTALKTKADESGLVAAVDSVMDAGVRDEIRKLSIWIIEMTKGNKHAKNIIDEAIEKLIHSRRMDNALPEKMFDVFESFYEKTDALREGKTFDAWTPALEPIKTYFGYADPSEFIVVAGGTGGGKSSFMRYEALEAAMAGRPVVTFNGENNPEWFASFAIAYFTGINTHKIKNPRMMSNSEWERFKAAKEKLLSIPWYHKQMNGMTVNDIEFSVRQLMAKEKLYLIQIDQIQNLSETKFESIEDASYKLRELAMSVKVPVMAAHQLKKTREQNEMPTELDMLYAGERAAKNIWIAWPQSLADKHARMFPENVVRGTELLPEKNRPVHVLRWVIAKNSSGPTGITDEVKWTRSTNRFVPLERNWRNNQPNGR